jgi:hypothetical protein
VTAASEWGGIAERETVRLGLPNSVEELMHETDKKAFCSTTSGWGGRSG